jgi:hypothetical protein
MLRRVALVTTEASEERIVTYQGGLHELYRRGFGLALDLFAIDYNCTDYIH